MMLKDIRERRYTVVVCWHTDRLTRRGGRHLLNTIHDIKEAGGRVEFVKQEYLNQTGPMGEIVLHIMGVMDEAESAHKSERIKMTNAAIDENKAWRGMVPYGYTVTGEKYNKKLVPDEYQAGVVREIADMYLNQSMGLLDIEAELNRRGEPTRTGKGKWRQTMLSVMLRNPALAGIHKIGYRSEGIIDWDTHERLVHRLNSRANRKGISPANVYLLTGFLHDEHGHPMYHVAAGGGKNHVYYCRPCRIGVPQARAEELVEDSFSRSQDPIIETTWEPGSDRSNEIALLKQELGGLPKKYDPVSPEYAARHAEILEEISVLADLPEDPGRMVEVYTGRVYGEEWDSWSVVRKRGELTDMKFRLVWDGDKFHASIHGQDINVKTSKMQSYLGRPLTPGQRAALTLMPSHETQ